MNQEIFERRMLRVFAKKNGIPAEYANLFAGSMKFSGFMLHVAFERFIRATIKPILAPPSKKRHVSAEKTE